MANYLSKKLSEHPFIVKSRAAPREQESASL